MYHLQLKNGEKVFSINDMGESFYIILKGSVGVQIPLVMMKKVQTKSGKSGMAIDDEFGKVTVMQEIKVLTAGMAFGEIALI